MQKISNSKGAKPNIRPGTGVKNASQTAGNVQTKDGEMTRIRILDYLGGGKLIVDLKGQRVVANTPLHLEKNQELEVLIKNLGGKIILQLMTDAGQNISIQQPGGKDTSLGDVMLRLMTLLEDAGSLSHAKLDGTLKEVMQKVWDLLQRVPVDATKPDLAQQIHDSVKTLGYDYENRLANAAAKGQLSADEASLQLKAELMRLLSTLREEPIQDRRIQAALLESASDMLNSIEFQQLKSVLQADRFQQFFMQIPFLLQDRVATAEVEFFRPKAGGDQEENSFSIVLNFDLKRLGHLEFVVNLMNKHIACQIKAGEYETYALARENSEDLEKRLSALGYNIGRILCTIEDPEAHSSRYKNQLVMDDIDITV